MLIDCKLGNPEDDTGFLIWRISKFWQRGKQRLLDEFGLTGPQLEVLGAIYYLTVQQTDVNQVVLSQKLDMDPMTTSTIVRNLQQKGWINRRESTTDCRCRVVELTELGTDLFQRAVLKIRNAQQEIFGNIDEEALKFQLRILLAELERHNK